MLKIASRICRRKYNLWENNTNSKMWYSDSANPSSTSKRNTSLPLTYNVIALPRKLASETECQEFMSVFSQIVNDLTNSYKDIAPATQRYATLLEYNVPNHQQSPGLAIVTAYKAFESTEKLTSKNIRLANILGWCVDMLMSAFQINDDILDGSDIRRGMPSWHLNKGIGNQAINDSVLIENGLYLLLKKYFSGHHCYIPCVELFHEITIITLLGQSLDIMNRVNGVPKLDEFTVKRYSSITKYKGSYPEYILPFKLAMLLAGISDADLYRQTENILFQLGEYFVAQNDILDCYGDLCLTGRVGNDIKEGKCTWLVTTALQKATNTQRQLLREHYGSPDPESELKIRTLYEELNILDMFLTYEENSFKTICDGINQMSKNLPQDFFFQLTKVTYRR